VKTGGASKNLGRLLWLSQWEGNATVVKFNKKAKSGRKEKAKRDVVKQN